MKNFVLGLAVCGCLTVCDGVRGMDNISGLVSDLAQDPSNSVRLTELVTELVDQENGFDNSLRANECVIRSQVALKNKDDFSKVCCMIDAILRDWLTRDCVESLKFYINGAKTGKFGPFAL